MKKRDDGESAEQKKAKMDEALSLWAAHDDKGGKEKEKEKEKDKKKEKEKKKGGIFGGKGKSKSSAVAEDEEDPKRAENMKLIDAKVHNIRGFSFFFFFFSFFPLIFFFFFFFLTEKKAHEIYVSEVAYVRSVEKVNHCLKQVRPPFLPLLPSSQSHSFFPPFPPFPPSLPPPPLLSFRLDKLLMRRIFVPSFVILRPFII